MRNEKPPLEMNILDPEPGDPPVRPVGSPPNDYSEYDTVNI